MNMFYATSRIGYLVSVAALALAGCAESSFMLAPDSRLPAWFEIPAGHTRGELTVTMDYYVFSSGREAKFKMLDSRGRQLMAKQGTLEGSAPLKLQSTSQASRYPSYEVIAVDGVAEVIEHRKMEPVFYINENPAVRRELGVK